MFEYKSCNCVDRSKIYEAFKIGFSDYIVKVEMPEDMFFKRFFGPEGNSLENSFIAFDGDRPIGLILGGIKDYDGVKTMRCGTLTVAPEYRGKGVSQQLFRLHREEAESNSCKQLFLEVIAGNDRAIKFYKKLGYKQAYNILYFTLNNLCSILAKASNSKAVIKEISNEELKFLRNNIKHIHINWQNDIEALVLTEGERHYGAYTDGNLIGAVSANGNGRLGFIWVQPDHRRAGIATDLLQKVIRESNLNKLVLSFSSNIPLQSFAEHLGFVKDSIWQYEMYNTL